MSSIYQQVELSESEIQREIDGISAIAGQFDDDDSQSWLL